MAIIKIKRGLRANIPDLAVGEPGFCTDTKELFVGTGDGNKLVGEGTFLKLSGGTLTGALSLPLAAPTQPAHAANKAYVDNVASGLDVKASVKCVATVNQPLVVTGGDAIEYDYSDDNPVTIDGYPIVEGDRILLVGQIDYTENGIFFVKEAGGEGAPCRIARPPDAINGTLTGGAFVFVEQGTTYADTGWVCITDDDPFEIGNVPIEFTQFTGSGSSSFVALSDTPSSYALQGGSLVRVNAGESGLEFIDPATVGRTKFTELDDCPSAYENGKIVVSGALGIDFARNEVFGGLFSDVPSTIGSSNQTLLSNGTSMSFVDFKLTSLVDCPQIMGVDGQMLAVGPSDRLEFINVDDTPHNSHRNPISSNWAYDHSIADTNVHGAPAGSKLLHSTSEIDGGTF